MKPLNNRIRQPRSSFVVHRRHPLTRVVLKAGIGSCARLTLVVLALSLLSPKVGPIPAQAAWKLTNAQDQASFSSYAPVIFERAEEMNDKGGHSLLGIPGCVPCADDA